MPLRRGKTPRSVHLPGQVKHCGGANKSTGSRALLSFSFSTDGEMPKGFTYSITPDLLAEDLVLADFFKKDHQMK